MRDLVVPFGIGEADGDMLGTDPVEGGDTNEDSAFDLWACTIIQQADDVTVSPIRACPQSFRCIRHR